MAQSGPRRTANRRTDMSVVNPHAAGIDIGAQFHVVAVGPECTSEPVCSFRSFTSDLHELARWLRELKVTTVVMESTGVCWLPVFEILESYGFDVQLVNAREAKSMPGRESDVNDVQWAYRRAASTPHAGARHVLLHGSSHCSEAIAAAMVAGACIEHCAAKGVTSEKRIGRLMRQLGLQSRLCRLFPVVTTDCQQAYPVAPNMLARGFKASAPDRKWLVNMTFVATNGGRLYLALVLDLFITSSSARR